MVSARRTAIAIIGGGIGGLTAAAVLLRAGFDVQVYERSTALSEVGAGINIGPNASRILHRLGIAEVLGRTGVKPVTFDQRRWDDGCFLLRSPLGEAVESAFGAPYYTFHRGDLHRALADAIPADHVHLAHASRTSSTTATASKRISTMERRFQPTPSSERTEFIRPCATPCSVRKSLVSPTAWPIAPWCRRID
jgi:2-polyprenyl-6-methoxyphenol hydroxylase-like FAD-dependent oxidoreductase